MHIFGRHKYIFTEQITRDCLEKKKLRFPGKMFENREKNLDFWSIFKNLQNVHKMVSGVYKYTPGEIKA